jgi:hypothetical protein
VTETPEVRRAREEHEKLWIEAARLNGIDPHSNDYNPNIDRFENNSGDDSDDEAERELEGQVSNQHQSLARYPVLPYSTHITPENSKKFGHAVDDSVIVDSVKRVVRQQQQSEVEEVTSTPRGFFYSFDYPVPYLRSLIDAQSSDNIDKKIDFSAVDRLYHPLKIHNVQSRSIVSHENRVQRQASSQTISRLPSATVEVKRNNSEDVVKNQSKQDAANKFVNRKVLNRGSIKFGIKSISI